MITSTTVPNKPCQFVAVKKIDGELFSDTYRITKVVGVTSIFSLEILDGDVWVFVSGSQTRSDSCSLGYWSEGTVFILDI